ncbi:MAG: hypothetical protein JNL74_21155 [Fibrobacteres bacterium]|nr:hypothetical protein [Fibrobacterota bacterium]
MNNIKKSSLNRFIRTDTSVSIDSSSLAAIQSALLRTGAFDTVVARTTPDGMGGKTLSFFFNERRKYQPGFDGASAGLSMFGETQLWGSISPAVEIRDVCGRPQALSLVVSLPFMYGATLHWREYGLPFRTMTTGIVATARSAPYINSRYYSKSATGTLYIDNYFTPRLSARFSGTDEIARTWKIRHNWESGRNAVLTMEPEKIADQSTTIYPKTEEALSWAIAFNLDLRDNSLYTTKGTQTYIEGRQYFISRRGEDSTYKFNQLTASFKAYANPFDRQVAALHLKAIVRDKFDNINLSHRLLFHDESVYFMGFSGIGGTNIVFANFEYRFRLFRVDMEAMAPELNLSPLLMRHIKKLSYQGDLFVFSNNVAYFGRVLPNEVAGVIKNVPFTELGSDDLFNSAGLGARLIYPKLGHVLTAAIMWGRPEKYSTRLYASASLSF